MSDVGLRWSHTPLAQDHRCETNLLFDFVPVSNGCYDHDVSGKGCSDEHFCALTTFFYSLRILERKLLDFFKFLEDFSPLIQKLLQF